MFFGIAIVICIDGQTHASHVVMMPLLPGLCPYQAMTNHTCSTLGQEAGVSSGRSAMFYVVENWPLKSKLCASLLSPMVQDRTQSQFCIALVQQAINFPTMSILEILLNQIYF